MYTSVTSRRRKVFGENLLCFLRLCVSLIHSDDLKVDLKTSRSCRKRSGLPECRNRVASCRVSMVCFWQILLQKSFCGMGLKFSEPYVRQLNNDVGDHIA